MFRHRQGRLASLRSAGLPPIWVSFLLALILVLSLGWQQPSTAISISDVHNPRQANGGWVSDQADLISAEVESQLNQLLKELKASNGTELAVVTVPDTASYASPKAFTTELFNTWGIGKAGKDNGLLMVVSKGDRRVEIETGYGMEGILPDAKVGQLIRTEMIPAFKQGDYEQGILNGSIALVQSVEPTLTLPESLQVQRQETLDARTDEKREISRVKLRKVEAQHRKAQQRTLQQLRDDREWEEWEAQQAYQEQLKIDDKEQRGIRRSLYLQLLGIGVAIALWGYGFLYWWFNKHGEIAQINRFSDDPDRSQKERLLNSHTLSQSSLGYVQLAAVHRQGALYLAIVMLGMAIVSTTGVGILMTLIRDRTAITSAGTNGLWLLFLYCSTGLVIAMAAVTQVLAYTPLVAQQRKQFQALTQQLGLSELVVPKELNPLSGMIWIYFRAVSIWLGFVGWLLYLSPFNDVIVAGIAWVSSLYMSAKVWNVLRSKHLLLQEKISGTPYCSICQNPAKTDSTAGQWTVKLNQVLEKVHQTSMQPGPLNEWEQKAIEMGNISYRACYCQTCEPQLQNRFLATDAQEVLFNSTTFYLQRLQLQENITCPQCRADTLQDKFNQFKFLRYVTTKRRIGKCHSCDYQGSQTHFQLRFDLLLWELLCFPIVALNWLVNNVQFSSSGSGSSSSPYSCNSSGSSGSYDSGSSDFGEGSHFSGGSDFGGGDSGGGGAGESW